MDGPNEREVLWNLVRFLFQLTGNAGKPVLKHPVQAIADSNNDFITGCFFVAAPLCSRYTEYVFRRF